jgi:hypothetical protein
MIQDKLLVLMATAGGVEEGAGMGLMFKFIIGTRRTLGSCNCCPSNLCLAPIWEQEEYACTEVSIMSRREHHEFATFRLCDECFDAFLKAAHELEDPR